MKPPDSFPFFPEHFLSGTMYMSAEEVGIYIRLLCCQWTRGGIPNDPELIARMAGMQDACNKHATSITKDKFLEGSDGVLRNPKLELIRNKALERSKKMSERGKKAANARHSGSCNKHATSIQQACNKHATSNATSMQQAETPANGIYILNSTKETKESKESKELDSLEHQVLQELNSHLKQANLPAKFKLTSERRETIAARIKEVDGDIKGMSQALGRIVRMWRGTKYQNWLVPETLFKPDKFFKYYEQRDMPVIKEGKTELHDLKQELSRLEQKYINEKGTFESQHRDADGALLPEAYKRRREILDRIRELDNQ